MRIQGSTPSFSIWLLRRYPGCDFPPTPLPRRYTEPMAQSALLEPPQAPPPPVVTDDIVVFEGASWADYQRLLEVRGERPVPRLTYLEGVLELMSPSRPHESIKSMIGRLVEAYCMEVGIDLTPYGSWTLENKEAQRGVEPDECYVFGNVPEPERCDLAIEVIWTSGSIDKLEVYRQLRVQEVWIWKRARIEIFALSGEQYTAVARSNFLPNIDLDELLRFVDTKPMTRAVKEYRAVLEARGVGAGE